MKLTLFRDSGTLLVDGKARQVDITRLRKDIQMIEFDTEKGQGVIQWQEWVKTTVRDRDFAAEELAARVARRENKPEPEEPKYMLVEVHRPPTPITDWPEMGEFYELWEAAAPPLPPEPTPQQLAARERALRIDQRLEATNLAGMDLQQLKSMEWAELEAWYEQHFRTPAEQRELLKILTLALVRRVL